MLTGVRAGVVGSSPRGRGKLRAGFFSVVSVRLIPAWAGKTRSSSLSGLPVAAHPRVGGENHTYRMRQLIPVWLIPAWAGKTRCGRRRPCVRPAHPRVGGENPEHSRATMWVTGSSPRGRGKHLFYLLFTFLCRLIPAWAGKTLLPAYEALKHYGSSPRGRGKLADDGHAQPQRRLIPAWAGKTRARRG